MSSTEKYREIFLKKIVKQNTLCSLIHDIRKKKCFLKLNLVLFYLYILFPLISIYDYKKLFFNFYFTIRHQSHFQIGVIGYSSEHIIRTMKLRHYLTFIPMA